MRSIRLLFLLVAISLTGCATTVDNTPVPAGGTTVQQLQAQLTPSPTAAPAKCQSKLTGRVLDANSKPIKGATVQIKGGALSSPLSVRADDPGGYGFGGLCAGKYSFQVALPGQPLKPLASTATVDGSNWVKLDLTVK